MDLGNTQMTDTAVKRYRRKPGLDPRHALSWYSGHLTISCEAKGFAAVTQFLADVMNADLSHFIGFARVPGIGWHEATEACTHQEQLMRDLDIDRFNSGKGRVIFDFDLQARFVPVLSAVIARAIKRQVRSASDSELSFEVSSYFYKYPTHLWEELVGPPEPDPPPMPVAAIDWAPPPA